MMPGYDEVPWMAEVTWSLEWSLSSLKANASNQNQTLTLGSMSQKDLVR